MADALRHKALLLAWDAYNIVPSAGIRCQVNRKQI